MANAKISELTDASALSGTEQLACVQGGVTLKTTAADVAALGGKIVVAVTYAATTTVDLTNYSAYSVVVLDLTLTGNVTFNITNGTNGQAIKLRVRQDATGSRIWTSGANLRFSADITGITLSTGASKLDYIGFEWNGTDSKADVLATNYGFN